MQASVADLLPSYTDTKLKIASIAEILLNVVRERKDDERIHAIQRLLADLAENAFRLVLLGKYNRGKSSLMNAMLGHDWLPTGILPLTSVITTVRYGAREHISIRTEGSSLTHEIPLEELAQYVTEEHNPGNKKRVEMAEVKLPSDLLRYGFLFIDTPGLGSGISANTDATRRFLSEVDAAIVLLSFESPLDQEDIDLLLALHGLGRKVFIVMNKADLVSEAVREKVTSFVRERLAEQLGGGMPSVFAVSAREGLRARMAGDEQALNESGLWQFEGQLTEFLRTEKADLFLQRAMQRTSEFVEQEKLELVFSEQMQLEQRKQEAVHELEQQAQAVLEKTGAVFARLRQQLPGLFATILTDDLRAFLEEQKRELVANIDISKRLEVAGLGEWIRPRVATATRQIREAERRELEDMTNAFSDLKKRGDELLGRTNSEASGKLLRPSVIAMDRDVEILQLPAFEWKLPDWAAVIPSVWLRHKTISHLEKDFANAVESYCATIFASLDGACRHWLERAQRDVEQEIQIYTERFHELGNRRDTTGVKAIVRNLQEELDKIGRDYEQLGQKSAGKLVTSNNNRTKHWCFVCRKVAETTRHFLMRIQYELTKDPVLQQELGASSGFCPFHAWMYESIGSPQGIAQGYSFVLDSVASRLDQLANEESLSRISGELLGLLPDREKCRVCQVASTAESLALQEIVQRERQAQEYENLCLLHLTVFMAKVKDLHTAKAWIKEEAEIFRRLAQDMRQFALKHNALRGYLATENERDGYVYGLMQLVGERQLSFVRKIKDLL